MDFMEPSALVAGLIGLPSVQLLVTPLRNALTLGANHGSYSVARCYREAFASGAFRGGANMALGSVPASLALGPAFHSFQRLTGHEVLACGLAGLSESAILYAPETRNAQLAFHGKTQQWLPWGPGLGYHVARNMLAMSGLRVFGGPCSHALEPLLGGHLHPATLRICSDLLCNMAVSAMSTPLHMAYTWKVTNQDDKGLVEILRHQWLEKGRLRPTVGRDVVLRVAYNASIFTLYGAVERTVMTLWPRVFGT